MLRFTKLISTTISTARRVLLAQLRGFGAEGDDDNAEPVEGVGPGGIEVVQPLGLMARPVTTSQTEAIVVDVRDGDEQVALFILDKSGAVQSLEVGETRIHGVGSTAQQATVIRLRANGNIEITAKTGQDIILNGGTLKIARDSDPVRIGNLAGTAGPWPCLLTFTPEDANGIPGVPVVGTPAGVELSAVISNAGGAAHALA